MHNLKIRENENKGFSLVELIVVIAIMAVLTAVLAPALLSYVERSRAQKDDSAMSEVTNAVVLSLSDQDVYDEALTFLMGKNVSCYVDSTNFTSNPTATTPEATLNAAITKTTDNTVLFKGEYGSDGKMKDDTVDCYYMFTDDLRTEDEKEYFSAGVMRGVTITFSPVDNVMTMASGSINKLTRDSEAKTGTIEADMSTLYYRLRSTVGETIELTSATYRNSDYTVFVRLGSQGGTSAESQDLVTAYGQWNGTNLDIDK